MKFHQSMILSTIMRLNRTTLNNIRVMEQIKIMELLRGHFNIISLLKIRLLMKETIVLRERCNKMYLLLLTNKLSRIKIRLIRIINNNQKECH